MDKNDTTYRSHISSDLSKKQVGSKVKLSGWVHNRRDHGGLIFVDLRERSGLVQLAFSPDSNKEAHAKAEQLRNEFVIQVEGEVQNRPKEMVNPNLPTGEIEVIVDELKILSRADVLPFVINDETDVTEHMRLKHRYLDLRREEIRKNFEVRHQITKIIREVLDQNGFMDVETPFLTRSTPEGARDYLVPSRVYPGQFYALPQSPQLFKQMLMIGGFERYYQIVRCFRDEDLRADRQPEFTQLDLEMSFVERDGVFAVIESIFVRLFKEVLGQELKLPLLRLTHAQAMEKYGTDKPDIRFGLEQVDLTAHFLKSDFKIFSEVANSEGLIKAFACSEAASMSRSQLDKLGEAIAPYTKKPLSWLRWDGKELKGTLAKRFSDDERKLLLEKTGAGDETILFLLAGKRGEVHAGMDGLRQHLIKSLELKPSQKHALLWVIDFPLFEINDSGDLGASHHPFTSPVLEDVQHLDSAPQNVRSCAYDLVLDGSELGSGSIRIHDQELQQKIFETLGLPEEEIEARFGWFLEALKYGTPPHGGIALGLDRIAMLFAGRSSLRDVIAFPKTQAAQCLTTRAPAHVDGGQLKELSIDLLETE